MKIGDKVRFLSETGGGTIAGFKGNIVLVEDEDGFQIPTPVTDVVLVGDDNQYDTKNVIKAAQPSPKAPKATAADKPRADESDELSLDHTFKLPVEERKGGNVLSCYLAFVPMDVKAFSTTRFESYFVNDSNYYIRYTYLLAEGANWTLHASGEVEPNTKTFIEEFGHEDLNNYGRVAIQLLAYKRDKAFILKPAVDVQFRIDQVKFYKLHTFQENDFFEQPALLYPVVENDTVARPLVVDARQLKQEMYKNSNAEAAPKGSTKSADNYVRRYENGKGGNPFVIKHKGDEPVVVDLHANALLDTTAGMSAADILNYQLDTMRKTMEQYKQSKGKRIIFIHGKGEGVLRQSVIHELRYHYKNCPYQDASFQEYGYGATQVTIK